MSVQLSDLVATPSQTVGPFFHFGLTTDLTLGRLAEASVPGEHIRLRVRVLDGEGAPVPDAMVEIWQADAEGRYVAAPVEPGSPIRPDFISYGRLPTTVDGMAEFETVKPGPTDSGGGHPLAPHISVCLFARGLLRQVHTRIYFAEDPALGHDAVLALVPESRRATLMATPASGTPDVWHFDLRLQGERETVFFDL